MKFNLKKPCANCPFRNDIPKQQGWLGEDRAQGIVDSIIDLQQSFPCHKTTDLDGERSGKEQHCAGALIMLEHIERPNQMMRISERLGMYDRTQLEMDAPVFDDPVDFVAWHGEGA